jgi:geranylgeranyl diphosphate synthase, type I
MSSIATSSAVARVPTPRGLWGTEGLLEVEQQMRALAVGGRLDRLGVLLREHFDTGGKRLRARLALGAADALGVDRMRAVPWATACELLHNATLLHDDVQDGDRVRRGHDTAWVKHGVAHAITAGDLALMLPWRALESLDAPDDVLWQLGSALARQSCRVARGQADESDLLPRRQLSWSAYERVVMGKTAALFVLPVLGAARLAGLSKDDAQALADELYPLGVLYQVQDDVLDLYGDKGRDAVGSDIAEGKVSALVVEHLRRCPQDTDWLLAILSKPREHTTPDDIAQVIARFRDQGALDAVWERLNTIEDDIVSSKLLGAYPRLHALAVELVALAVAPIAHTAPVAARSARMA